MHPQIFELDQPLHFGKYEGFSTNEIFCGCQFLEQELINVFITEKLESILSFELETDNFRYISVSIEEYKILIDNQLLIKFQFEDSQNEQGSPSANIREDAFGYVAYGLYLDDTQLGKEIFGSPNDFIFKSNKKGLNFKPSADPGYIEWLINNLDIYTIDPVALKGLEESSCYHFYGIQLFRAYSNAEIYLYKVLLKSKNYKFSENTINLNLEKSRKAARVIS